MNFRSILCTVTMTLAVAACHVSDEASQLNYDSAHAIALEGDIVGGVVLTHSTNHSTIEREIREQLMYTIGQLNGLGGGPDMNRLQVSIQQVEPLEDGLHEATYNARLYIGWPRERTVPADFEFVLPAFGSWSGIAPFYEEYGSDEDEGKECLAWEAHDVSQSIFWYYYRPAKSSCSLLDSTFDDPRVVTRMTATLQVSHTNTENKYPEYEKVWEDGQLVVTAIFGKNDAGSTSPGDAGISAYAAFYNDLVWRFGTPDTTNLAPGERPSADNDDVRLTFTTPSGLLDVHAYLVDGIRSVNDEFRQKYNERTQISDFVSYSGHSGLGANIRALARMGEFSPGQYQLFLINGCDTFAYVDDALRDAHHAVNPDSGPDKYFDIITNAMPSYFSQNSRSNMAIINGMIEQQATYREILSRFDRAQRAAVTGEQDNRWPLPFDEG